MRRLEEKVSVKKNYCPKCINEGVEISWRLDVLEADDGKLDQVEYWLPQIECLDCGVSAAFESVDAMHDAACFAQNLVTPEQIKIIRKKHGMNTKQFAELTGIGETTIKRWESRAFYPNKSDTNLIKLIARHGPDLIYEMRAAEQLDFGAVPVEVEREVNKIFTEVRKQQPSVIDSAHENSKQIIALLG